MRVVFVAPRLSDNAAKMVEAVGNLPGVTLGLVTTDFIDSADASTRAVVAQHWRVNDVLDLNQLREGVAEVVARIGGIDRLFGAYEQLQVPLAELREERGLPGLSVQAALNFRDKSRMKDVLRAHHLPCAKHATVERFTDAIAFAERVGFPLVLKPLAGAGSQSTYRVDDAQSLSEALELTKPSHAAPLILEEFIVGSEHSFETISIDGHAIWHSLTHYHPTPLEVIRNPWMQWVVVLPRDVDHPRYDDIKAVAVHALTALGQTTGLTHMEWFRRADGSVAISEVAARPPGAQITTLVSRANDIDFVGAWARLMVFGEFTVPERKYAVAAAFLRGQGQGVIRRIRGLDRVQQEVGDLICDFRLPEIGASPTGTYDGDGYIIVRHPETAVVERAIRRVVELVHVELG
jgi:phosphoribosylaminoimidazole carboxylase (NCAIR synthetase)